MKLTLVCNAKKGGGWVGGGIPFAIGKTLYDKKL